MNGGGGAGGGSGHRSQSFKTQNHKSQSFHMIISQITDNIHCNHREFGNLANVSALY